MAFQINQPIPTQHGAYPKILYRGTTGLRVHTAEQEQAALDAGHSHTAPVIPPPEEPKPVLSVEDRLQVLEDRIAALEAPKGKRTTKREDIQAAMEAEDFAAYEKLASARDGKRKREE